jgi:tetratricopeptide (TPR) repeat protein
LDPFSLAIGASAGLVLSLAGHHDEAVEQCLKTLEMDPTGFYQTHFVLGASYEVKGRLDDAARSLQSAVDLSNRNPHMLAALGHALATSGRTKDALQVAAELKQRTGLRYVPPYNIAMVYAGPGEKDAAFEWLERACDDRSIWYTRCSMICGLIPGSVAFSTAWLPAWFGLTSKTRSAALPPCQKLLPD